MQLAISLARSSAADPDSTTHEIRKCTKRIRSLLRLFKGGLEETTYRAEMQRFRDVSARLAAHRLSRVNLDIVSLVAADRRHRLDNGTLNRFRDALQNQHHLFTLEQLKTGLHADTETCLEGSSLRAISTDLEIDFSRVSQQIARTQRRFRKNLKVLEQQDAEAMHEIRKNVKTLWYQLTLVRPLWQPVLGATIHQLDMLAEKLGRDHDLHEMILFLQERESTYPGSVPAGMINYLEKKRNARIKDILSLAGKLGAEKPSALGERLEGYFRNL